MLFNHNPHHYENSNSKQKQYSSQQSNKKNSTPQKIQLKRDKSITRQRSNNSQVNNNMNKSNNSLFNNNVNNNTNSKSNMKNKSININNSYSNMNKTVSPNISKLSNNSNNKNVDRPSVFTSSQPYFNNNYNNNNNSNLYPPILSNLKNNSNFKNNPNPNLPSTRQQLQSYIKNLILFDPVTSLPYPNIIQKHFRDGSTYLGQYNPINNTKQGSGIYFYYQGDIYGGNWLHDRLDGMGYYYFVNGDKYQGEVKNGQKNGYGVYQYVNGNKYDGEWKNDKKHGKGKYFYNDKEKEQVYHGQWKEGYKNGIGKINYKNGDTYEGQFLKNKKNGQAVYFNKQHKYNLYAIWSNDKINFQQKVKIQFYNNNNNNNKISSTFQGYLQPTNTNDIINSLINISITGYGTYIFGNIFTYHGYFINNNLTSSSCSIQYQNNDTFNGSIQNNLFNSYGQYYYKQKCCKYIGNWINGLQQGDGVVEYDNGTIIKGKWKQGKIVEQYAEINYVNNDRYEGGVNDLGRHGKGTYYRCLQKINRSQQQYQVIEGEFSNNKLVHVYQLKYH